MINKKAIYLLHFMLVVIAFVWIYPLVWVVSSSFKSNLTFFTLNPWPGVFHLENYVRAWRVADFSIYFLNSVVITGAVVIIVLVLSSMTGYVLGRYHFPGRRIIIGCIVALMFIPKGYTIIPLFQLVKSIGLLNNILGVILAESSGAHVLFILLFAAFFSSIPRELQEAASIDGCGFPGTFLRVMLPSAVPIIATVAIMEGVFSWNDFMTPLVLTLNNPHLRTLSVGMFSFIGDYTIDWTGLTAGATIALIPVVLMFILMQRFFVEGVAGSIKQ